MVCVAALSSVSAQTAHKASNASSSERDVLIFTDGEKLIGQFERSNGDSVIFKSDMAGEITVSWNKIRELHSSQKFAVAEKGMKFGRHEDTSKVPQGAIAMTDQTIKITPAPVSTAQQIPVADAKYVIDQPTFEKALERPKLYESWKGAASFGASLVLATQNDRNYTSAVALTRAIPGEPWMDRENRTTIDFTSSFGELKQPGQPNVKTSIFHADAERDEYFEDKLYVFVAGNFDHNYSLGLSLQQTLGTGVGWTVVKQADQELDLKGEVTYVHQDFQDPTKNQQLIGSIFGQSYDRKLLKKIAFHQDLSIAPSWNNTNAYSAAGNMNFSVPVFKRMGLTLGALDTFLNNPSPGFRKNSFQFTTSATYTLP